VRNGCGYCENWHILQDVVSRSDRIMDWYVVQDAVSSSEVYIAAVHCAGRC